jgi:hypothetical protein
MQHAHSENKTLTRASQSKHVVVHAADAEGGGGGGGGGGGVWERGKRSMRS